MAINTCAIAGQIVEISAPRGTEERPILPFRINAVEQYTNSRTGKPERRDNVLLVACYGALAAEMARRLAVGMHVTIQGRLKHATWTNGRGVPCDAFEVAAQAVTIHQEEPTNPTFSGGQVVDSQGGVTPSGWQAIQKAQEAMAGAYDII